MGFLRFVAGVVTSNFLFDFLRYFLAAAAVWLMIVLCRARGMLRRKIRQDFPAGRQMFREFLNSVRTVVIFSIVGASAIFLLNLAGAHIVLHWAGNLSPIYVASSIAAIIVIHDAYFYWTHRLMHHPRLFGLFHREHHRSHNPSPWSAYSFAIPEAIVQGLFIPLYVMVVPTPGFVIVLYFMTFQIVANVLGHSGFEVYPRRLVLGRATGVLTGVVHHDIHHATVRHNFGLYFRIWDRLMGTEHPKFPEIYDHVRSKSNSQDAYGRLL